MKKRRPSETDWISIEISSDNGCGGGCATGADRAVFVTKTSVSILDIDSTPPGLSIAYDRVEGFIGPAYQSGGAPPVVGIMKSDGKLVSTFVYGNRLIMIFQN